MSPSTANVDASMLSRHRLGLSGPLTAWLRPPKSRSKRSGSPRRERRRPYLFEVLESRDLMTATPFGVPASSPAHEVIFLDASLDEASFADSLVRSADVYILQPGDSALQQMADVLSGYHDLSAVHVVTHGSAGSLEFTGTDWSPASGSGTEDLWSSIAGSLSPDGDLVFWGCDFAQPDFTQGWLTELSTQTGIDIAASTNRTGDAALGGDWLLEFQVGSIEATSPFNPAAELGLLASVPVTAPQTVANTNAAQQIVSGDLDGDGQLDLIVAELDGTIVWYRNCQGSFGDPVTNRQVLLAGGSGRSISDLAVADLDADGDLDIVFADTNNCLLQWVSNEDGVGGTWQTNTLDNNAPSLNSIAIGDLDDDGLLDILVAATSNGGEVNWYRGLGDGLFAARVNLVTGFGNDPVDLTLADVDKDGDDDLLLADTNAGQLLLLRNDGTENFVSEVIQSGINGLEAMQVGDLDRDGTLDIVSASADGLFFHQGQGDGTFAATLLADPISNPVDLTLVDFDQDGDVDVLLGARTTTAALYLENLGTPLTGTGNWTSHTLATTTAPGIRSLIVGDWDRDGDLDLAGIAGSGDTALLIANQTIHHSVTIAASHDIAAAVSSANTVIHADLDGDGWDDLLLADAFLGTVVWHRNLGDGTFAASQEIANTISGASGVAVGDLDGDGRLDVVITGFDNDEVKIALQQPAGTFNLAAVSMDPDGGGPASGDSDGPVAVELADLDGDGDLDIVTAAEAGQTIVWFENTTADAQNWSHFDLGAYVPPGYAIKDIKTGDINGDGILDIAATALNPNTQAGKLVWLEGSGLTGAGAFSNAYTLIAQPHGIEELELVDMDRDGTLDVVASVPGSSKIAWYANVSGDGSSWTAHVVTYSTSSVRHFEALDFDQDGDIDIVASLAQGGVVWFANNGSQLFTYQPLASGDVGSTHLTLFDIDHDGDLDIASVASDIDLLQWHENRGGQFAMVTIGRAPETLSPGEVAEIFQLQLLSRGRAGDANVRLDTLRFLLTDANENPLSDAEAADLLASLQLYRDTNGNGTLDANDLLVSQLDQFVLTNGLLEWDVSAAQLESTWGSPTRLFVAAQVGPGTNGGLAGDFRITHLTDSPAGSSAVDANAHLPLVLEYAPNVSATSLIWGIANVEVLENTYQSHVDLAGEIPLTGQQTFTLIGMTYPGLLQSYIIDNTTGVLTLRYQAGVFGESNLTVRVVDAATGRSAETTFTVRVLETNSPPTTTGIADISVPFAASLPSLLLSNYFADQEDGSGGLTYSIVSISDGTLLEVSIDPSTLTLSLAARDNAFGQTTLVVRGTDSGGQYVETSFQVTIGTGTDANESNDTLLSASGFGTLGLGDNTPFATQTTVLFAANIHAGSDIDLYRFSLATTMQVTLDVIADRLGGTLDGVLRLLDASGAEIARSDDLVGRDPSLSKSLAAGTYYVDVRSFAGSIGNYQLQMTTVQPGPRVLRLTPSGTTGTAPTSLSIQLDNTPLNASTVNLAAAALHSIDAFGATTDLSNQVSSITYDAATRRLSVTLSSPLADGSYQLTLRDTIQSSMGAALDGDGVNGAGGDFVGSFAVDTTAPVEIVPLHLAAVAGTNHTGTLYTFEATVAELFPAAAGERLNIALDVDGDGYDDGTATAIVGADGRATFRITATRGVASGLAAATIQAIVTDERGNTRTLLTTLDTRLPRVTAASILGNTVQVTFDADFADPAAAGVLNIASYQLTGRTITGVVYDAATRTATLQLAGNNLAEGAYSLTIRSGSGGISRSGYALDGDSDGTAGGNFERTLIVDLTLPQVQPGSFQLSTASDTGVSNSDGITNVAQPTFWIDVSDLFPNTSVGSLTVELSVDGNPLFSDGRATVLLSSSAVRRIAVTLDAPLSEGLHTVTARVRDAAGNVATTLPEIAVTVHRTPPSVTNIAVTATASANSLPDGLRYIIDFSAAIDAATASNLANYRLVAAGGDSNFTDFNNLIVTQGLTITQLTPTRVQIEATGLAADNYRLTILASQMTDLAGNGLQGGNPYRDFQLTTNGPQVESVFFTAPLGGDPTRLIVQFRDAFGLRTASGTPLWDTPFAMAATVPANGVSILDPQSSRFLSAQVERANGVTQFTLNFADALNGEEARRGSNYLLQSATDGSYLEITSDQITYDAVLQRVVISVNGLPPGNYFLRIDGDTADQLDTASATNTGNYVLQRLNGNGAVVETIALSTPYLTELSGRVLLSRADGAAFTTGTYRLTLSDQIRNVSGQPLAGGPQTIANLQASRQQQPIDGGALSGNVTALDQRTVEVLSSVDEAQKSLTNAAFASRLLQEISLLAASPQAANWSSEQLATAINARIEQLFQAEIAATYSNLDFLPDEYVVVWGRGVRFVVNDPLDDADLSAPQRTRLGIDLDGTAIKLIPGAVLAFDSAHVLDANALSLAIIPVNRLTEIRGNERTSFSDGRAALPDLNYSVEVEGQAATNQLGVLAFGAQGTSESLAFVDQRVGSTTTQALDLSNTLSGFDTNLMAFNDELLQELERLFGSSLDAEEGLLVFWTDPVDFILTDPTGRRIGHDGLQNYSTPGTYYSGNAATELVVIPGALAGSYHLELMGAGNQYRGVASLYRDGHWITAPIQGFLGSQGAFAGDNHLALVLDFHDGLSNPIPGQPGPPIVAPPNTPRVDTISGILPADAFSRAAGINSLLSRVQNTFNTIALTATNLTSGQRMADGDVAPNSNGARIRQDRGGGGDSTDAARGAKDLAAKVAELAIDALLNVREAAEDFFEQSLPGGDLLLELAANLVHDTGFIPLAVGLDQAFGMNLKGWKSVVGQLAEATRGSTLGGSTLSVGPVGEQAPGVRGATSQSFESFQSLPPAGESPQSLAAAPAPITAFWESAPVEDDSLNAGATFFAVATAATLRPVSGSAKRPDEEEATTKQADS